MKTRTEIKTELSAKYSSEVEKLEAERADIVKRHESELAGVDQRIMEVKVRLESITKLKI